MGEYMSINYYEAETFTKEMIQEMKNNRKIFTVFSTFGEREADLVKNKISLFNHELGDLCDSIILSHRRMKHDVQESTEEKALEGSYSTDILICNHYNFLSDMKDEKGKGADMRRALHFINTEKNASPNDIILFLDTDVVTEYFGVHFFYGLVGPLLKDRCDFSKASFWREMGRVKKYVAQPLFSSIEHPALSKITDLSYPLSGEVAGTVNFFNNVHFWQIYGVETGINIDAVVNNYNIADVNLGKYDHEHNSEVNIQKMCFGIIRTYLKQLIDYGIVELKDGAKISNNFKASLINGECNRENMDFDLTEIKYQPLKYVLK